MSNKVIMNQQKQGMLKTLIPKLIINWLVPLLLYMLLRNTFSNDTTALAVSGVIPAIWTIVLWLWHRQVNWIGVIAIVGLLIAIVFSALLGGGSLPLKLYHPVISGTVGLIFLISVVIRKPLMIVLLKKFKAGDPNRFSNPVINRKVTIVTAVFGSTLLLDALIHIMMALTLSTGIYLFMSRIVTIAMLVILFFTSKWVMRRKLL
jgi:hypothetical protein